MTTLVPTRRDDRTLALIGVGAALLGPLTLAADVVVFVVVVLLYRRGEQRTAGFLVALLVLAHAVSVLFIVGFTLPVGID